MTTTIAVGGPSPYDVLVGHGLLARLPPFVDGATRAVVVADEQVKDRAEAAQHVLREAGVDAAVHVLPPGEQAKSLDVLASLWDALGRRRLTRNDAIVAVGGGATTDVAGFAAATWLRGVRVVHVPTTLLGMVDAAVGGKTAINTAAGKNLVGAFHPPAAVLADLDVLDTLPPQEWTNGMAEVVKAGFLADPRILDLSVAEPTDEVKRELVERSIRFKAEVVTADLRESGLREVLNYGHTLGHAVERVESYRIPHGHAVSIGMVYVAALSRLAGRLDDATARRHGEVLSAVGLPTTYDGHGFDELLDAMRIDKKARGATLRFVVLDGLAKPAMLEAPDEALLRAAFEELQAA